MQNRVPIADLQLRTFYSQTLQLTDLLFCGY